MKNSRPAVLRILVYHIIMSLNADLLAGRELLISLTRNGLVDRGVGVDLREKGAFLDGLDVAGEMLRRFLRPLRPRPQRRGPALTWGAPWRT